MLLRRPLLQTGLRRRHIGTIPGPTKWPVVGTLPDWLGRNDYGRTVNLEKTFTGMYNTYGDIFKTHLGHTNVYVLNPDDMQLILQNQGEFPRGGAEAVWPLRKMYTEWAESSVPGCPRSGPHSDIIEHGPKWRAARSALSPAITSPAVAITYLPAIAKAAALGSAMLDRYGNNVDEFSQRMVFDMFAALALGRFERTVDQDNSSAEAKEFVDQTVVGMNALAPLLFNPLSRFYGSQYNDCKVNLEASFRQATHFTRQVVDDHLAGKGDEFTKASYVAKLLDKGTLSKEDVESAVCALLQAGVDTTSHASNWFLLNMARSPEAQERLYQELREELKGGDLTAEAKLPFLKACLKESYRFTPLSPGLVEKTANKDLILRGHTIPANTIVTLLGCKLKDPNVVPEADQFKPERYLADAVKARKGTPASIIDHVLTAGPFSAGMRMCLGSRVAGLEMQALGARVFQDWKLTLLPDQEFGTKQLLFAKPDPFPKFKIERRE